MKRNQLLLDLKISRPGLWFPTLWIYLVPFGNQDGFWKSIPFWLGILFVTFPLNYLVYGLNDYKDVQADAFNARKGNFLFGAKASVAELKPILKRITLVIVPFIILFSYMAGLKMFGLLVLMILVNIAYNFEPFRLKERPPFEILIQVGYVMTAFFSTELNGLESLPWQTLVYLSLFAFQAHIAGELMDIEPDIAAGKRTTATLLKRKNTKMLMLVLLLAEGYLLWHWFQDGVLASFLGIFALWLILDAFIFFKDKPYSLVQMKWFGYAINLSALISMLWVLYSGKLLLP
ncbi:UbiA family prenyltransferase [Spongiimicrobium salis]|uniref:UbiA family prenyltransferase n=1 Tax=Spongiimicrobium salis TaxID=1667022 RepID=UPI00374D8875